MLCCNGGDMEEYSRWEDTNKEVSVLEIVLIRLKIRITEDPCQ
jgi:hypothetical protein